MTTEYTEDRCGFSGEFGQCVKVATETLEVAEIATGRLGTIRACKFHADKFEKDDKRRAV